MKKLFAALAAVAALSAQAAEELNVAATAVPHAEILEFVKPALAKDGVELDIKVFTDYVQPNIQVAEKRLDANFFQHQPYLDEFNKGKGTELVSVTGVHIEPFGAYSSQHKSLDDLPNGATVVIPNDATNGGRALLLLDKAGVIGLTLPAARDLASWGIRVCTIAPGIFYTPLLMGLPQDTLDLLGKQVPFPKRTGHDFEFGSLALEIVRNDYLNGETIRLDGAIRMAPK